MSIKYELAQVKFPLDYDKDLITFFINSHGRIKYKENLHYRD